MKKQMTKQPLWVTVFVWRGLIQKVKAFRTEAAALKQEQRWRKQMDEQYDEVGVFKLKA
jgi:hypothetical protein